MSRALLVPAQHLGLVVGNRESRMVLLAVVVEASVEQQPTGKRVDRFRDANGRWTSAKTVLRRLEALGLKVTKLDIGEPGIHTPIY